ncbi:MAG: hypothetical protein R8P61_11650 [Bacteroidia bacterium]|nr:hypothetical protein [Bacteroidia bacterium]
MRSTATILFSILFIFSGFLQAQPEATEENLSATLTEYISLVENMDLGGTVEYLHPKLFEMAPKEMLKQAMEQAFADSSISFRMYDGEISKIHDILTVEEGSYALVDYKFTMDMQFKLDESNPDSVDSDLESIEMTGSILAMQHGEENVSLDKESRTLTITANNTMYAILEDGFDSWKFLEKKPNMMGLLDQIIPESVKEKLE